MALAVCCFFILIEPAFAAQGLMIIPPVVEKEAVPGVGIKGQLELNNPTDASIVLYPSIMEFKAKGETGEPDFDFSQTGNSEIASWFKYDKNMIALEPNQYTYFNYEILVPETAEPGGHYATIFFSSEPPNQAGGAPKVNIISKVGTLVLIKVPGDVNEALKIKEFSVDSKFLSQKAKFNIRLENTGNVHVKPKGNITIKNIAGKEIASLNFNPSSGNVLPNTVRRFEIEWTGGKYSFGKYTAEFSAVYGEKNNALIETIDFWIVPWWAIAALVVMIILLWSLSRRRRKRHRYWR